MAALEKLDDHADDSGVTMTHMIGDQMVHQERTQRERCNFYMVEIIYYQHTTGDIQSVRPVWIFRPHRKENILSSFIGVKGYGMLQRKNHSAADVFLSFFATSFDGKMK